jgi:hypothetical protein
MPAGKQYTSSMPFVVLDPGGGHWIYYQRPVDRALLKIKDDGSKFSQIGTNTTASTPFVLRDANGRAWVYFQGTDNALWKVGDDGNDQHHIGENMPADKQYTASMPWVVREPNGPASVYYKGTDNTLWKIRDDGTLKSQIGNNTTASTPFAVPDSMGRASWLYFQGTDNALWKTRNGAVDPDPVTTWVNNYTRVLFLMGGKGVALGTDADGLSPLIQQDVIPTQYPFTLNFGCPTAPADCPALPLTPYKVSDKRTFDFQIDGTANYGMLPDFIQAASQKRIGFMDGKIAPTDPSLPGGGITALFHSAEDTIAMWEAVTTAAANIKP